MYKFNFELQPAKELDPTGSLMYLTISLISCITNKSVNLVKLVLENIEQLDWFSENEIALRKDKCPIDFNDKYSIAAGMSLLYDEIDPKNTDDLEKLYEYRTRHALRFAFRGQDLPDIFIASNNNGHEISCAETNSTYKYDVDINSLFEEVDKSKDELERLVS